MPRTAGGGPPPPRLAGRTPTVNVRHRQTTRQKKLPRGLGPRGSVGTIMRPDRAGRELARLAGRGKSPPDVFPRL